MTEPRDTRSGEHPQALLLPLLEGQLSQEERAMVENHINQCRECSTTYRSLQSLVERLRTDKDLFCPEPWQLHEFVETRKDPEGKLGDHISRCALCQEDIASYKVGPKSAGLPDRVRIAVARCLPAEAPAVTLPRLAAAATLLREWLGGMSRFSGVAVAAAAAVLAVVLLYPRGEIEPLVGLSSVTWSQPQQALVPKHSPFATAKPLVGTLIVFKGLKTPPRQEMVDELYEALKPTADMRRVFGFVAPADVSRIITEEPTAKRDLNEVIEKLHGDLGVTSAVVAEISETRKGFRIDGRLVEVATGRTVETKVQEGIAEQDLTGALRNSLASLLTSR